MPEKPDNVNPEGVASPGDRNTNDRINISGDTVTQATADYPEEHRRLVRWLFSFAKDEDLSWDELAEKTKVHRSTLWRVFQGTYTNPESGKQVDLSPLCEKIDRFKDLAEERATANKLPFIETSVWRRISKICRESLVSQFFGFIYGESQIGKTCCLKEFARRNNHGNTVYVLMPASAGVQSMMKAIAEACHISSNTCFENLRDRVGRYLDDSKLLIIDEVHEAFVSYQKLSMVKSFSMIRQIQEISKCGVVLCGTNVFRNHLEQGEFAKSLEQLRKRGIWRLQLESTPSPADLELIAKFYKLPPATNDAKVVVDQVAESMGLGMFTKFLARASKLALDQQEKFTWEHFVRTVRIAEKLREIPKHRKD